MYSTLSFHYIPGSNAYYIGVNDIVNEGEFVWISSGQNATYLNWGPDQPNNRWGNENCVVIRNDPGQGFDMTWSDDPCTDLNTYICEMPYVFTFVLSYYILQGFMYGNIGIIYIS